ncbi:NADPH-dependent FMN reductase [Micromonospora sp. NPDC050397]|uniref:NADPH-dependent FMN reductase n=1 Tax=Micromonospora sp. NPDC050397 TaxID=3364279 RepID=UPI00384A4979
MPKLYVIIASTRPGRVGLPVGQWFVDRAEQHGAFDVELVDLAEWDLPMMAEPHHPRIRQYESQQALDWSAKMDVGDAYVLVMPEYNHSFTAPLKNAVDYLHHEWAYKPVGLVSYGGIAAGTRAQQAIKPVLLTLKMVPLKESVMIPYVGRLRSEDGTGITPTETMESMATALLDELARWALALKPMRETPSVLTRPQGMVAQS